MVLKTANIFIFHLKDRITIVFDEVNILYKYQEDSKCQSRDITENHNITETLNILLESLHKFKEVVKSYFKAN